MLRGHFEEVRESSWCYRESLLPVLQPELLLCHFYCVSEAAIMSVNVRIDSPNVQYTDTHITARYSYQTTSVHRDGNNITVTFLRRAYRQVRHPRTLTSLFGT